MSLLEVAYFMRQHGNEFLDWMTLDLSVIKDNLFSLPKSGKECIGLT